MKHSTTYKVFLSTLNSVLSRGQKKVKCCISFLRHLLHCTKKQNIPHDAAWKKLQFRKDSLFYSCTFCFQNEQNSEALVFDASKKSYFLMHDEFVFFLFHLFIAWCVLLKRKQNTPQDAAWKDEIRKKWIHLVPKNIPFSYCQNLLTQNFVYFEKSAIIK